MRADKFLSLLLVVQVNPGSLYSLEGQQKDSGAIYRPEKQQEDSNAISTSVYSPEKQQKDPNALPETSDEADEVIQYPDRVSLFIPSIYNKPHMSHSLSEVDKCVIQAGEAMSKQKRPRRLRPPSPERMEQRCKQLFKKWKKKTNLKASSCRAKFFVECRRKLLTFWPSNGLDAGAQKQNTT